MGFESLHPAVAAWFRSEFEAPTGVQLQSWEAIKRGAATLISAPTGSGKTLAAFLAVIDDLVRVSLAGGLADETHVLYVSPLKALSNDIQKNLQAPLVGIRRELLSAALPDAPIRAWVRSGDTPQSERARMRRTPPHILVTTPESLYILLTSESGRRMLGTVRTVIVDEIHALAGNKRGAHLALSLERLEALCAAPPVRIGVSATTKPLSTVADFLTGGKGAECTVIDAGHVRERDLALELPGSPLEAVMANEVWTEIYDRLAELIRAHTTTLVFVNTRRLAERAARQLAERLGEDAVTSHHGSLAKEHRLAAEQRLKAGALKALVATSSLELGIDVGEIDLVCQLGSPRAIAAFLQRVGRSGHGLGRMPKGRLFPLTRDELVECAALLDAAAREELDSMHPRKAPLDVLAQQIAAEVAMREWPLDELYARFRRAAPYREFPPAAFEAVVSMLAEGFATQRGRRGAHLHYDRVNRELRPRRAARLTAITNGGVIPDQFDYDVVLLPAEHPIGTVNEDFAFESMAGDIFQLGNTSYRIRKVETGKVYVEDAQGAPPSIPFWFGEAPGRSDELSAAVSRLRGRVDEVLETRGLKAAVGGAAVAELAATTASEGGIDAACAHLMAELGLARPAAEQLVAYLAAGKAALGTLPTQETIVFERFFDETGDAHLVIHSPYGSRINRAWGLALRKRFCRRFNFELQAAALEDSIVISLGAVHSFALEEVAAYLKSATVREVLRQAVLAAPMFPTQWRWNATTALAVRRFRNGKRAPPQFQRSDAEDLLAVVFPDQLACAENLGGGDRTIPDHPLVEQTLADTTQGAMDIAGLERLLASIEKGEVKVLCHDLTGPSPLAQEILGAKPYAFLDDAPQEERRTLAVQSRRYMTPEQAADLGRLDADAIAGVRAEAWPEARDADELHDALVTLGFMTAAEGAAGASAWPGYFAELRRGRRATTFEAPGGELLWAAAERLAELELVFPRGTAGRDAARLPTAVADADAALIELLRGRLEGLGPVTAADLGRPLGLTAEAAAAPLAALEQQGFVMRGRFEPSARAEQWCERRLLARIHRYTLKRLRSEIEPVSLADYQRFLFVWQGLGSERRQGKDALRAAIADLQGCALPAASWERDVLPARIADYGADLLDQLCAAGEIVWWRPRRAAPSGPRPSTVAGSPIVVVPRASLTHWRLSSGQGGAQAAGGLALAESKAGVAVLSGSASAGSASAGSAIAESAIGGSAAESSLSSAAARVAAALTECGALFFVEIVEASGLLRVQVEEALSELVARGLVTADSFNGLRALLTPHRRRTGFHGRNRHQGLRSGFDAAGRWALLGNPASAAGGAAGTVPDRGAMARAPAGRRAAAGAAANMPAGGAPSVNVPAETLEFVALRLLRRYGVVCRAVLARETLAPSWRELLGVYRRLEARGEIRGGRFVAPFGGEQFALPEAVETLRRVRRGAGEDEWIVLSAADPVNLASLGAVARVPAVPTRQLIFRAGEPVAVRGAAGIEWLRPASETEQRRVAAMFAAPLRSGPRRARGRGSQSAQYRPNADYPWSTIPPRGRLLVKIAVLFGGDSVERDVSAASAAQVVGALRAGGHEVLAVDASRGVLPPAEEKALLSGRIDRLPPAPAGGAGLPAVVTRLDLAEVDLIFLALHGGTGEDGSMQAVLDLAGIPYTGTGRLGSALGMDKDISKRLFLAAGVPTPEWLMAPADAVTVAERLGFPVIVKPNAEGSTVGLALVEEPARLQSAVEAAASFDGSAMIERYVAGRELTVGVLDDEPLAVGEIIPAQGAIFDYNAKYQAGGAQEIFPADLSPEQTRHVQSLGLAVHRALKLECYSRADFRMDAEGGLWCLEVNTLPGLTAGSLLPRSAAAAGISFQELCERICAAALRKPRGR